MICTVKPGCLKLLTPGAAVSLHLPKQHNTVAPVEQIEHMNINDE